MTRQAPSHRAVLRQQGEEAFAFWESLGRPRLCPCCGGWSTPDGEPGPRLPHCTTRLTDPVGSDTRVWTCAESCRRLLYAHDLCTDCASEHPEQVPDDLPAVDRADERGEDDPPHTTRP